MEFVWTLWRQEVLLGMYHSYHSIEDIAHRFGISPEQAQNAIDIYCAEDENDLDYHGEA